MSSYKPYGADYSQEHIDKVRHGLIRQINDLYSFLNAYSDTICSSILTSESGYQAYLKLYEQLGATSVELNKEQPKK